MVLTKHLWQPVTRRLPYLLLFLIVTVTYSFGLLDFLDQELTDARFRILEREASQDVLLVEIDAASLQELSVWPWPRSYHAQVIDNLREARVERIVFDVDFSAHSTPREDDALEHALARSEGLVVLPVFVQFSQQDGLDAAPVLTAPIPSLERHVALASANVLPDSDGLIRRMSHREHWGYESMPTLFAALSDKEPEEANPFYIDYGIKPQTFPRISYADVLLGRFEPQQVAGKKILVGATALELGDTLSVPVHQALPGVVIQLLAHESVLQGRALQRLPRAAILFAAFVILLILGPCLADTTWRRDLAVLGGLAAFFLLLSLCVQATAPILLDVAPLLLATLLSYGAALVSRVNQQDFRLMAQRLVIRRRDVFMRKVLDNSLDGILVLDQNLALLDCNKSAVKLLGIRGEWGAGQSLNQVTDKIPNPEVGPQLEVALRRRGGPHLLRVGGDRSGTRFIQAMVSNTLVDEEHKVIALLRDVTDEKRAKIQAKKARLHLQDALESIHEGFALYDKADRLVLSNSKFQQLLLGDEPVALQGMTFEEVMRQSNQTGRIVAARDDAEAWLKARVTEHRRKEGSYQEEIEGGIHLQVSERSTSGGGTVAIYHDVTTLKEREQELREAVERESYANRCKTEFLANMSHELRTPLNAIIGFSEIIASEMLGPIGNQQYKSYSDDVVNSGRHLLELINEILDVSKIDAGKYDLDEEEVDVPDIIASCLRMLKVRIVEANLQLEVDIEENLPGLYASPRALKQVLLNLLSNAIKFTDEMGSLFVEARVADDGRLVIRIVDTGIGMAEEDIPNAFAVFGQVDSKLARSYEGAGLGLPLALKLMELHGGDLLLESEVDIGTVATVTFPANRVLGLEAPPIAASSA